jgi:integrase
MASAWVQPMKSPRVRYRVFFRVGGRESRTQHGGIFKTKREAEARREWVRGELAAMRVPRLELMQPQSVVTLATVAEQWRQSRVDVADGTATTHRVNLSRILPRIGMTPVEAIIAADVASLVADLVQQGLARESIRKTRATLAMVLDFAGVQPNPARDRSVKLPPEDRAEVNPPTAAHVEAVLRLVSSTYRLPLLVLDATGMRVGELEQLRWGDVDELEGKWRVSAKVAKTRRARWVPVPAVVFKAVVELVPREDRDLDGQVFADFGADKLRTAIGRVCKATGVPAFSPHDLRHRRATLWHVGGVPVVEAAAWLGHSPTEHLRTYAHATLVDRRETDYSASLWNRASHSSGSSAAKVLQPSAGS